MQEYSWAKKDMGTWKTCTEQEQWSWVCSHLLHCYCNISDARNKHSFKTKETGK